MRNKPVSAPAPEEIWKILKEVSLGQRELDRLIKKARLENDRRERETDRKIQENDRLIKAIDGRFGNQWGELIEALIEGSLLQLLNERSIRVNRAIPNYKGEFKGKKKEFDLIAVNGGEIVVIETKSHLSQKKTDQFLDTMREFKEHCPEFGALRVYAGMACLKGKEEVFSYAESRGLFVIRVSGRNAVLMNHKAFEPKAFNSPAKAGIKTAARAKPPRKSGH